MQRNTETENSRNELIRSEEIQKQIQALSSRDLQLWSIGILVMLVLSAGFLALVFPNVAWRNEVNINAHLLPQFFFGLITLIVLFNVYMISQKNALNATRRELIRELVFSERMESLSLLDPATQLYNRRALDQMLTQEVARANRGGINLTLMMMKVKSLEVVKARYGAEAGDKFIVEVAKLLKSTFRGSDTLTRYSNDQFLVLMPGTSEDQAEFAVRRLQEGIDSWNLTTKTGWEINLAHALASHVTGCDAGDLLRAIERKMLPTRDKLVPVFLPLKLEDGQASHVMV
jgi:diguanylate cyclase (GGDEF)-like protein